MIIRDMQVDVKCPVCRKVRPPSYFIKPPDATIEICFICDLAAREGIKALNAEVYSGE